MGQNQAAQCYEIVCLEFQGHCLYAEVIQVICGRQRSWLRPLALLISSNSENEPLSDDVGTICDLRRCSDLLWPQAQLRPAFDTELLPLLEQLQHEPPTVGDGNVAHAQQKLHRFLRRVCETLSESSSEETIESS